ncbi:MAG: hypothetical protein HPY89_00655 [Pelotomaculum sp.]|uniref:Hypothetical membrane protein n=1 Tax=Pelotomaculum thermopropionicum (strain DSM 13744 / JCM 10971 / SI) TaxID=370438 RepID=A5CZD5_PELTS|nr:hypothetical protein [Pelotomaculum sp.]BAF60666.1 hypothetical membrane protein [Pelotomaculum thermopropionicum SI]
MFGLMNLVFTAFVKFYAWLATKGWPFGAGVLTGAILTEFFYVSYPVALVISGIVTLVCLWVRYEKRHPEKAKALKERYFPRKEG